VAPSPGGALGTAGLSRGGERRTGLLLAQEGHWGAGRTQRGGHKEAWVPAYAGMTPAPACAGRTQWPPHPARPSALPPATLPRWGEAYWTAACAGRTLWPPHPAVPWAPPASPAVGRGVLDCCLRRKDTKGHTQRSLGSCLRGNDTCSGLRGKDTVPPSPGGAQGTAGLSRGGERRTGLPLTQE
jgi:hypothetical protein